MKDDGLKAQQENNTIHRINFKVYSHRKRYRAVPCIQGNAYGVNAPLQWCPVVGDKGLYWPCHFGDRDVNVVTGFGACLVE